MGFFDEIGKKISQTASDSAKKTREFVEVTKLNSQISDEKRSITNLYAQIGEKYFHDTLANPQPAYADLFRAVEAANQKVASLQEEIQKIRNVRICENCGAESTDGSSFCAGCGAPFPIVPPAAEPAPATKTCANCGAQLPDNAAFCTACGNKANADEGINPPPQQ